MMLWKHLTSWESEQNGLTVYTVKLWGDGNVLCTGSFNWFSAREGKYQRYGTSLVYRGENVKGEIIYQPGPADVVTRSILGLSALFMLS